MSGGPCGVKTKWYWYDGTEKRESQVGRLSCVEAIRSALAKMTVGRLSLGGGLTAVGVVWGDRKLTT